VHIVVLVAAGSMMPARKSEPVAPGRASVMVFVHLPRLAPGAGGEPKEAPAGATPARMERAKPGRGSNAPPRPAEPILQGTGHSGDDVQAPAAIAESIAAAAGPFPAPTSENRLGNESAHAAGEGAEVAPAEYLHTPEPRYPESAREDGEEGLVVLRVRISTDGRPEEIRIDRSSGFRALDSAAVAGLKHWTFVPARRGLRTLESWMDIPIRFRLR
jgi:protein TonB